MKKLGMLLVLILCAVAVPDAAWFLTDDYEPIQVSTSGTNVSTTLSTRYTIAKPPSGQRNCFTDVSVSATNFGSVYTFSILEGVATTAATNYMIDVSTGILNKSWPKDDPLCLTPGTTGFFQFIGTSATWKMNGRGFIKK